MEKASLAEFLSTLHSAAKQIRSERLKKHGGGQISVAMLVMIHCPLSTK